MKIAMLQLLSLLIVLKTGQALAWLVVNGY